MSVNFESGLAAWSHSRGFTELGTGYQALRQGENSLASPLEAAFVFGRAESVRGLVEQLLPHLSGAFQRAGTLAFRSLSYCTSISVFIGVIALKFSCAASSRVQPFLDKAVRALNWTLPLLLTAAAVAAAAYGQFALLAGISLGVLQRPLLNFLLKRTSLEIAAAAEHLIPIFSSLLCFATTTSPLLAALYFLAAAEHFSPRLWDQCAYKADALLHFFFSSFSDLPLLEEAEKPLQTRPPLSHDEILSIWNGQDSDFELHPPHLTFDAYAALEAQSRKRRAPPFSELSALWQRQKARWEQDPSLDPGTLFLQLFRKVYADNRFVAYLKTIAPHADIPPIPDPNDPHFTPEMGRTFQTRVRDALAQIAPTPPNAFLLRWMTTQMGMLVRKLEGDVSHQGTLSELCKAKKLMQDLLPILSRLEEEDPNSPVLTRSLLEIAVAAGDYCNLGITKTLEEMRLSFLDPQLHALERRDPSRAFELSLLIHLQFLRETLVRQLYETRLNHPLLKDKEGYATYSSAFSFGFLPRDPEDSLLLPLLYTFFRRDLPIRYRREISNVWTNVSQIPGSNCGGHRSIAYLGRWIQTHRGLSNSQKGELKKRITLDGTLSRKELLEVRADADFYHKLQRLTLVVAGVWRKKRSP